jgi:predicted ATPase/class 3 adenylate cyclase
LRTETLTFLFTDIEGSTRLLRRLGEKVYGAALAQHHEVIRAALAAHGGTEIDTQGDGFFAVFSSPHACAAAAAEMQRALEAHRWPEGERIRVRMGVHAGEATRTTTGLVGLDVHRAARIGAVAQGGQVVLSETAAALVRDRLPSGSGLRDLGLHRLKDLGRPEHLFQLEAAGMRADFPPLRSLDNPALANNLPAQLASFIGRERELADVRRLLESGRLVTLTGAGGSGKTRLGLQLAAELLDGSGDGVWLVELAPVSDEQAVAAAVASTLRIAVQAGRPALEILTDALLSQNLLIVLDNCEHLLDGCAVVVDTILVRCPNVHFVVTSREPLGITGETIYRVPSLSLLDSEESELAAAKRSDAVALFLERARAQGVEIALDEQAAPLLVSICRRLDGMPLAIELAAARLRSMSLADLSERLDQRFRLLTGGSRSALERQQTLRATVDWSYRLLDPGERSVLHRLSVFVDGFDLEAAESVCGLGELESFEVADLLGSLVDKSLVVAEPREDAIRYRLLETIREFAAERLAEQGGDEVALIGEAHCRHYLAVAERTAPHLTGADQGRWLVRLDADHANLHRALEHAVDDIDRTESALRLGAALRNYWLRRPDVETPVALLTAAVERADPECDPKAVGTCLLAIGEFVAGHSRDLTEARRLCGRAVQIARESSDPPLLADSLATQALVLYVAEGPAAGLPLADESVQLARTLDDAVLLGKALPVLLLCSPALDRDSVEALTSEALACLERSGDRHRAMVLRINLGWDALRSGNIEAARTHLEAAAELEREVGSERHNVAVNLGWVLREEQDAAGATAKFSDAVRISRRQGDNSGLAYATLGLACLAGDHGEWEKASVLHGVAAAFLERAGEQCEEPDSSYRLASIDLARDRIGVEQFERAYARGKRLSFEEAINEALAAVVSHANPSGSVKGSASLPITSRCDPVPSAGTPASLARARRL